MGRMCEECHTFGCRHKRRTEQTNVVQIGDQLDDVMSTIADGVSFSSCNSSTINASKIRVADPIIGPAIASPTRILITPSSIHSGNNTNSAKSEGKEYTSPTTDLQSRIDFEKCGICDAFVHRGYLAQHLYIHSHNPEKWFSELASQIPSANTNKTSLALIKSETSSTKYSHESNLQYQHKPSVPKLHKIEKYEFRPIEEVSFTSSTSTSGKYWDITVILWHTEKTTINTSHHMGGSSYAAKIRERCVLNIVYNCEDDFFAITPKFVTPNPYQTHEKEDSISDRICTQENLAQTLKRILLWFRVSPTEAFEFFKKAFNNELVISRDVDNGTVIVQSYNFEEQNKQSKYISPHTSHHDYDGMYD